MESVAAFFKPLKQFTVLRRYVKTLTFTFLDDKILNTYLLFFIRENSYCHERVLLLCGLFHGNNTNTTKGVLGYA